MGLHKIRRGLSLPIAGAPDQSSIEPIRTVRRVGILADDYVGMRPTMQVTVGDDVRRGQPLFEDKKTAGVRYTSPASGRVAAINRGERRALRSIVIELSRDEREGRGGADARFSTFSGRHPRALSDEDVRALLLESGLWTAIRGRPFGRVADPGVKPHSIFVTAIDTNPLAPDLERVLEGDHGAFELGLTALAKLTEGPVFVCTAPGSSVPVPADDRLRREEFSGPHPAGTAGVHIHWLDPVDRHKVVWHLGCQDVVAMGRLFETGALSVDRIVALAGPAVERPRLVKTRLGASTDDLVAGELVEGEVRVVSGSVLSGRKAAGEVGFLGRYEQQVSALREGRAREFLGWLTPGFDRFSTIRTFASKLLPGRRFDFTTSTNGSKRAIVPIGMYERVMPMDLMATPLLRALVMTDVEKAEQLGCLELIEEDLALCTFVCPGKTDYGPHVREVLTELEKEG